MNAIWTIAKKELSTFFDSLVAYFLLTIFLFLCGLFTWFILSDVFLTNQASLRTFFFWAGVLLMVFIPAITMGMLAEEKNTGTIELLLTKSVSDRQVVIGKFVACFLLVVIALAFTLPYYFTVAYLGNIDHGATICGYLGLILVSASYISLCLFASSITKSQIVAFLLGLVICFFLGFVFFFLSMQTNGLISEVFQTLSVRDHYESIARGVIDTKDLIYFLSLTTIGILLAEVSITNR